MSLDSLIGRAERDAEASAGVQTMLVVSPDGGIQFATARAERWMRDIFPAASPQNRLPEALTRWLANGASGTASKFVLEGPERNLSIYALCQEPQSVCLLLEQNSADRPASASAHNRLTERQKEVLAWVANGKTNAEIGQILGLATRTIGKHLERIYPKLGVENRTAAARFAYESKRNEPNGAL